MKKLPTNEIYDPHLKVSKYQWGEKKGTDHMKKMTPGERVASFKTSLKETKLPVLLMNNEQKKQLREENSQLEFDGIQTKNLDMCPSAYKLFKEMIQTIRAGKHIGEPTGHSPDRLQNINGTPEMAKRPEELQALRTSSAARRQVEVGATMKPKYLKHMQTKMHSID